MKKVLFIIVSLWFFAIIFSLESCHKDEKVDPCKALHQTSADFTIMEDHSNIVDVDKAWKYYSCDTVSSLYVRFTAKDSLADSYEWHIGAGIYNNRSVSLNFPTSLVGQSIPVMLILTKKPNSNCFPKDNGIDTITKKVYFVEGCTHSLIKGTFVGYNTLSPKDTFSVSIDLCKPSPYPFQTQTTGSFVNNILPGCKLFVSDNGNLYGYKELLFLSGGVVCNYGGINGIATIGPSKDEIIIDYSYYADVTTSNLTKKKFVGKRKIK